MSDLKQRTRYIGFGAYQPSRWQLLRRRIPMLRIRREHGIWQVTRRWRDGSVCEARSHSLRWALARARRGGASLYLPIDSGDITLGPSYTHVFDGRKRS